MTTNTNTTQSTWRADVAAAHRMLSDVVAAVQSDQWQLPTPCSEWTVTQVIQHAAGDQLAYASALGVGGGPDYDPFAPSGSVDGSPLALVQAANERTAAAWDAVDDDTEAVPTPLPHGELPIAVASGACALDAAVHAWDVAIAIGQPSPLDEELSGHLLAVAREIVEPLRQYGAYAAEIEADEDSSNEAQLLRYLGRQPR